MKCPVCQVELKIADRAGIEIDYCPNCRGVWLDRGELDKIIERALQEPLSGSPPPPPRSAPPPQRTAPPRYDDDRYDYPEHDPRYDPHRGYKRRKKRNWLEDLFDVFD